MVWVRIGCGQSFRAYKPYRISPTAHIQFADELICRVHIKIMAVFMDSKRIRRVSAFLITAIINKYKHYRGVLTEPTERGLNGADADEE